MKNMSERGESIKAWETFIQSLTVENLLDRYMESHSMLENPYYMASGNVDDNGNEIGLQTYGDYMRILYRGVWYIFGTPLGLWDRNMVMDIDKELLHLIDFEIVRDFIGILEL